MAKSTPAGANGKTGEIDHPIFGFYASESGQAAVMSYLRNTVKVRGFVM